MILDKIESEKDQEFIESTETSGIHEITEENVNKRVAELVKENEIGLSRFDPKDFYEAIQQHKFDGLMDAPVGLYKGQLVEAKSRGIESINDIVLDPSELNFLYRLLS